MHSPRPDAPTEPHQEGVTEVRFDVSISMSNHSRLIVWPLCDRAADRTSHPNLAWSVRELLGGCASGTDILPPPAPFTPVPVDFTHAWKAGTHPFTGAAVIDIDGDGFRVVQLGAQATTVVR